MSDTIKERLDIILDKGRKNWSKARSSIVAEDLLHIDGQTKHLSIDGVHVRRYIILKRL